MMVKLGVCAGVDEIDVASVPAVVRHYEGRD